MRAAAWGLARRLRRGPAPSPTLTPWMLPVPDLSFLGILVAAVGGYLLARRLKRPRLVRCKACRLEMVYDGDLPEAVDMIPNVTRGLAPPPPRMAMFHCPGCGRRVRVTG